MKKNNYNLDLKAWVRVGEGIAQTNNSKNNAQNKLLINSKTEKNQNNIFNKQAELNYFTIIIICFFIFIININFVSADSGCCLKLKNNNTCQDISDSNLCDGSILPMACTSVDSCKQVCCISDRGLCAPNSPKANCTSRYSEQASCSIPECREACCMLGSNSQVVTENYCSYLANFTGKPFDFRQSISNPLECLFIAGLRISGACVIEVEGERTCKTTERLACSGLHGTFYNNTLCTNPILNTTCEKTEETTCVEGKDEVYFKDSCGNIANIYDSSKVNDINYWKFPVTKTNSCNSNTGNIESAECGNCNYLKGSRCGSSNGKNICKDMNCKNIQDSSGKTTRKNGEAWCIYDSQVGNSAEAVGSRHWKYYCLDGEVKSEPCSDLRQEVCGKINITNQPAPNNTIETAESIGCVPNRWRECVKVTNDFYGDLNDPKKQNDFFKNLENNKTGEYRKKCEDIGQCNYYEMKLLKTPIIPVCEPKFPGGLRFWTGNNQSQQATKDTCSIATNTPYIGTCVKIKDTCGGCLSGCECGTEKWLKEANNICRSFGDCGANVNINGQVTTDGYKSWVGKTEQKQKQGLKLNETYLNSLKNLVINKTKENAQIKYDSLSGNFSSILGKVRGGGGGINGPLAAEGNLFSKIPIIGDFFNMILKAFGMIDDCSIKKTYYHFTCMPYQAPKGGADCEKFNDDLLKPISEYRCKSLGAGCDFINEGTMRQMCYWTDKNDTSKPLISPWQSILVNASYERVSGSGNNWRISGDRDGCITPYTFYSIGINVSKPSQCKVSSNSSRFDDKEDWIEDSSYARLHQSNLSFPSPGHIYDSYGINISNTEEFYIRCEDKNGIESDELKISLCIDAGPDNDVPELVRTIPENNAFIGFNTTSLFSFFAFNEPIECKYSSQNKNFLDMENNMDCAREIYETSDFTYLCNTTLLTENTSYYIKCKDQPWLGNSSKRNIGNYSFNLRKSTSELRITRLEPNASITSGTQPVSVNLRAETSGGAEDGKAVCEWSWQGTSAKFLETSAKIHRQPNVRVYSGITRIPVKCRDIAGNSAEGNIEISIVLDNNPPQVTRVFNQNSIKIFTDEDSECAYSNADCSFVFENSTKMNGLQKEHSTIAELGKTYYVKCKDLWGNKPDSCTIVVKTSMPVEKSEFE